MMLASLLTEDIYRHKNGLKHMNISDSEGFSALFVVNTPIFDNSGVAHAVEHMIFRGSAAFPNPETLFQLTSLTDAKINASTFADTTYFHCQSQCSHTFMLAINYLLNGLFNPIFDAEDLHCEIHDGNDKGVIYRELLGAEQSNNNRTYTNEKKEFCYGGSSASIGELSRYDLRRFHQRFYHPNNITLLTANADIKKISTLMSLLPKRKKQAVQKNVTLNMHKETHENANTNLKTSKKSHEKFSHAINNLINIYHLTLYKPCYQEIENEIEISHKRPIANKNILPAFLRNNLIASLVGLSNEYINEDINNKALKADVKNIVKKPLSISASLPHLFTELCQLAKKKLACNALKYQKRYAYASDKNNALWLTNLGVKEQIIANITSYIISAYPKFLVPRCQGLCYATQALIIENSAFLVIYSAYDVDPVVRLKQVPACLLALSQDINYIRMSLALGKVKYCRVNQVNKEQAMNITPTEISSYLQTLVKRTFYKV